MRKSLLAVVAVLALIVGVGCSSGSSGGGGGTSGTADIVVGDSGWDSCDSLFALWLDILSFSGPGFPTPDAIIDLDDELKANRFAFANGDLVVSITDSGPGSQGGCVPGTATESEVRIYRDYTALTDSSSPDVVLDTTTSLIDFPWDVAVGNDALFVADCGDDVLIFQDFDNLSDAQAPDIALVNSGTNGLVCPAGLHYDATDDRLFVANWTNSAGEACVSIFNNVQDNTGTVEPDVRLDADVTFDFLNFDGCRTVVVSNNVMYVSGGYDEYAFAFNDADALTDSSLPDAILYGNQSGSNVNTITDMTIDGNNLWIANKNAQFNTANVPDGSPGVVGFNTSSFLLDSSTPNVMLTPEVSGLGTADRVRFGGGGMFVVGAPSYDPFDDDFQEASQNIYVFQSASSVFSGSPASMVLTGHEDPTVSPVNYPSSLGAVTRGLDQISSDSGT